MLAVLGFAAFQSPDPSPEEVRLDAAANSMGHSSGAYAGVSFGYATGESAVASKNSANSNLATDDEYDTAEGTVASRSAGWLSQVEVRALVEIHFEPGDVNQAMRIAWCESRFDPDSVDRKTGGVGLFRHLPRYWEQRAANAGFTDADPTDPEASIAAAAWEVYNGGGWDIFACAN